MAEHRLSTQILLRYDTYSRWMGSEVILQQGEAAIAAFPDPDPTKPPKAVGIKMGDGEHYFEELPWVQGIAADVYTWAKQINKPIYTANEISGLESYIAAYIASHGGGGGGGSSSSSSSYRLYYDTNNQQYILQYFDDIENDWINTTSVIDLSTLNIRIQYLENWANGSFTNIGENLEQPLLLSIRDELIAQLSRLTVDDMPVAHQFVTAVSQDSGKITVRRKTINTNDIEEGILSVAHGGLGANEFERGTALIGNDQGAIQTKSIVNIINEEERNNLASTGAIISYVADKTSDLENAMHYIGEANAVIINNSRVDPQINGYNFRDAKLGDTVLSGTQEFLWTGTVWRLVGDEGGYAVKGQIVNADIAEEANISQSKIADLTDTFAQKVDKVEGKQLSSNDYTDEEHQKLADIEDQAQVNIIEHVFLNNEEVLPSVVNNLSKSIDLHFNGMTLEQGEKLNNIEPGAQVNVIEQIQLNSNPLPINNKIVNIELIEYTAEEKEKLGTISEGAEPNTIEAIVMDGNDITPDENGTVNLISNPEYANTIEHIYVNNNELTPTTINGEPKSVNVVIDEAALTFQIVKGARYPTSTTTYTDIEIDNTTKKLELSHLAATGDVQHLLQAQGTYITLDCGTSNSDTHPPITA